MSPQIRRHVVFSHGQDSSPFSRKILALYEIAEAEGYHAAAVDYRGIDDAEERVLALSDFCKDLSGELVLVGSSLGAWVSLAAAPSLHARGLFLMAPAITMPGLPALRSGSLAAPMTLVHGWRDDVVPCEQSIDFARAHGASLHLVESDHRLHTALPLIRNLFQYFLAELDLPVPLE
ncbi:MAG: alpha/beta fold hydrolase [Steroidobacteraceae bacterium]